jgi:hypothetical protein
MKSVGSQQFRRRSDLWTCSCGGSSDDGRSERVNEGVDCGVKIACRLSLRTQCCSTLLCPVRYSVQWSGTVQSTESACCGKARIARNGWVQMGGRPHIAPTSHAVIPTSFV